MTARKEHCPRKQERLITIEDVNGPFDLAMCGRWVSFESHDRAETRQIWKNHIKHYGAPDYFCRLCVRRLTQQVQR